MIRDAYDFTVLHPALSSYWVLFDRPLDTRKVTVGKLNLWKFMASAGPNENEIAVVVTPGARIP